MIFQNLNKKQINYYSKIDHTHYYIINNIMLSKVDESNKSITNNDFYITPFPLFSSSLLILIKYY